MGVAAAALDARVGELSELGFSRTDLLLLTLLPSVGLKETSDGRGLTPDCILVAVDDAEGRRKSVIDGR